MSKKEVGLKDILKDLIRIAEFTPDKNFNKDLSSGLRISVKKAGDVFNIGISRRNIQPSMMEWSIVMKNFPFNIKMPTPKIYKIDGRIYMVVFVK